MSLLRWPHDHHRELRTRMPAYAPANPHIARDQDRYLMTPSQPIDDRSDRRHSRWFVSSNGSARDAALEFTARCAANPGAHHPADHDSAASSPQHCQQPIAAPAPRQPPPPSRRGQIPIAPAAPPRTTSRRDFVPWRFSNAGRPRAWLHRDCRRPKTCAIPAVSRCSKPDCYSITSSAKM